MQALENNKQSGGTTDAGGDNATVAFLMRRMQHMKDFPALSESMSAINRIVASDDESANTLAAVILKDFALTNKLLKVVNSAVYGHAGKISTVSRAVVILGFENVRSIAVTLLFLGHLQNKSQIHDLQEEVIGTLLAGLLARELTRDADPQSAESAFLFAIYQSLGRMLAYYYFYDEAVEIQRSVVQDGIGESAAARRVLGVTYEELATEIARSWNFPQEMLRAMSHLPADDDLPKPKNAREKLWLTANLAEDLRRINLNCPTDERSSELGRLVDRYRTALPVTKDRLRNATSGATKALGEEAQALNIDTRRSQVLATLDTIERQHRRRQAQSAKAPDGQDFSHTMSIDFEGSQRVAILKDADQADAQAVLTAGIQDITATLVGEFKLNELLHMVIETMYSGMGFTRVVLAIRNDGTQRIEGRLGLGKNIDDALRKFLLPMNGAGDLFSAALKHNRDIMIADADADELRSRLPDWFRQAFRPASFILFPLTIDSRPFGLFYAEQEHADGLNLNKAEADLLITLRNQAVLAIRQSSRR